MSVVFAIEPLRQCWNEVMVIAHAHWKETEGYRHGQEFNPSYERYAPYDESGWYAMFTMRAEGVLVGYAGMYCTPSMHTQKLIATEDTFYIDPAFRRGRNFLNLHKFVIEEMQRRGAVEVCMTVKVSNPGASRLLEYLDYEKVSVQYSKSLARADSASDKLPVTEKSDVCSISPASP